MVCFIVSGLNGYSQDSTFTINTAFFDSAKFYSIKVSQAEFNFLYHSPEKKDRKFYNHYKHLLNKTPDEDNYDKYNELACCLWNLEKPGAEKMYLKIFNSTEKHYCNTYYHSSDIPGDTTVNTYGYGSYTSSYKNEACIYLAKIYIEQKRFDEALKYLDFATGKYVVNYTCGTGYHWQKDQYDFLYSSCYDGLKMYDKVLDLLFPDCLERNDGMNIHAIKSLYLPDAIAWNLESAEHSIVCSLDSFPSYATRSNNSDSNMEHIDTLIYYTGTASIKLFGRTINIPTPALENGEHITKEHFIRAFKESEFYITLKDFAG